MKHRYPEKRRPPSYGCNGYPWPEMDVGQQRVIAGANPISVRAAASNYGKRHGMRFEAHAVETVLIVRRVK